MQQEKLLNEYGSLSSEYIGEYVGVIKGLLLILSQKIKTLSTEDQV